MKTFLYPVVRAILIAIGGAAFSSNDDVEKVVGALVFLSGIAWSIIEKKYFPATPETKSETKGSLSKPETKP